MAQTVSITPWYLHPEAVPQGFEAFYDLAITPWMGLTPNIQVISPAQQRVVSVVGPPLPIVNKKDIYMTTIAGFRLQLIF